MPNIQRVVNAAFRPAMDGNPESLQARYVPLEPWRDDHPGQPSVVVLPVPEPYAHRFVTAKQIERSLPDADVRALLEMNDLVVLRDEIVTEERELDSYLDRAGLAGGERERAATLAPGRSWRVEVGWYLARKPGG